jgi:hypothetical protein
MFYQIIIQKSKTYAIFKKNDGAFYESSQSWEN